MTRLIERLIAAGVILAACGCAGTERAGFVELRAENRG